MQTLAFTVVVLLLGTGLVLNVAVLFCFVVRSLRVLQLRRSSCSVMPRARLATAHH